MIQPDTDDVWTTSNLKSQVRNIQFWSQEELDTKVGGIIIYFTGIQSKPQIKFYIIRYNLEKISTFSFNKVKNMCLCLLPVKA